MRGLGLSFSFLSWFYYIFIQKNLGKLCESRKTDLCYCYFDAGNVQFVAICHFPHFCAPPTFGRIFAQQKCRVKLRWNRKQRQNIFQKTIWIFLKVHRPRTQESPIKKTQKHHLHSFCPIVYAKKVQEKNTSCYLHLSHVFFPRFFDRFKLNIDYECMWMMVH